MNLISAQAAYNLTIQSQQAIDTILLQSNQSVDILNIEGKNCKENNIQDDLYGNMLLTTLKVDSEDIKKVSMKIRTAEGTLGSLQVFVLPRTL